MEKNVRNFMNVLKSGEGKKYEREPDILVSAELSEMLT